MANYIIKITTNSIRKRINSIERKISLHLRNSEKLDFIFFVFLPPFPLRMFGPLLEARTQVAKIVA